MALYTFTVTRLDPALLAADVSTALTVAPTRIDTDGDALSVWFTDALSPADETALGALVAANPLKGTKRAKYAAINARTKALVDAGYVYQNKHLGLGLDAQIQYIGLELGVIVTSSDPNLPQIQYPVLWNVLDDNEAPLSLADATAVHTLFLTAFGTFRYWKDTGTALLAQVRAATTLAEVGAIVDPR
jgi:hypothetical protein